MISILSMVKTGQYRDFIRIRFEFEFDDASLLPIGTYTWGVKTYFIEEGSKARDTINNIYYEYIKGKWSKIITPPIPTFKTPKNTTYNDNGEYSVSNNDLVGFNDIKVDVSSTPSTLIEKSITENNTYNASDDGADGYSSVNVDVANSYTVQDEGKVVSDGTLVAQTAMQEEVTENGTINTTLYNSVTVNVSGGGSISDSDVKFYDYDGTLVASYSAADFASLSAMPENPTHDGLTAQGWNWSLADAKAYVAAYGKLNIGQMYITDDGKTRLYIQVSGYSRDVNFKLTIASGADVVIDWGDYESGTYTGTGSEVTLNHTYDSFGDYIITITAETGNYVLGSIENLLLRKVEIGEGVTALAEGAFHDIMWLRCISIPKGIESIPKNAFNYCTGLIAAVIPDTVTLIDTSAYSDCGNLQVVSIPKSVTSIGDSAFQGCGSLRFVALPNSMTSIANYCFGSCNLSEGLVIPNSVTTIGTYVFQYLVGLNSIVFPNSITNIGESVFEGVTILESVTFQSSIPPVLGGNLQLAETCKLRIPQGSLSAYTSASNYPSPTYYIYEEY